MKNKKLRNILILSIVTIMFIFTLSGCGQDADQTEEPNEDTNEDANGDMDGDSEGKPTSDLRPEGVPADYPNQNISYIYGFSPGSVQDVYIRLLFDKVKEMEGWDYDMVIDYREGGSGRISWSAVADAEPDGYTIGFAPSAMLISAQAEQLSYKYDNVSYIFNMMSDPGAIGVGADSDYNTLEELVQAAKENPGKVTIGVTSTIGQEGLTMIQIEEAAGVDFNVVAFDGGAEVITQVMGGHIDGFCLNISDTTSFIEDEVIKVVATGAAERSEFLPDVPTYTEAGYDVIQVNMRAVAGPKDMPEPIRQYLSNCLMAAAADPEIMAEAESMQIPLDNLTGEEVGEAFNKIGKDLETLWEENPWQ